MPQKTSPFLEGKWGWNLGEDGWNSGADENWLKFSYMFDRNVDGIVSSLPPAVNGTAYFNTVDNRFYFVVDGTYYSSPCPKWFVFTIRSTGEQYQFNGSFAEIFKTPSYQISYKIEDPNSVEQTVQQKLEQTVSTKDYGALCDGTTDDTLAVKNTILAVQQAGGGEIFHPGLSVITETLVVPDGVSIRSIGKGYEKRPVGGFIFKGAGLKSYSIADATSISITNPDAGAPYLSDSDNRGDNYSTLDLSVPFSAAVILGKGSRLLDMGMIPWFDGLSGYEGSDGRLSDEWDVGVWCRNASGWQLQNVTSDGHWRKSGLLVTSSPIGDGQVPQCELGQAINCSFGGFRGVSIRAPRNASGASNYGFAGTDFINCFIRSLNHQSLCLATSSTLTTPFPSPSACLEMDGSTVLRGVQFTNCTFMGRDDICVISDFSSETLFQGCYEESKAIRVSGVFQDSFIGSRMVATANTAAFFWHGNTKYAVDFSPYFTKDTSLTTSRYTFTNPGVFSPATAQDSEWERPNFSTSYGIRLRAGQGFRIYDSSFNNPFSVTETGSMSADGNITINNTNAGLYSISNANPIIRRFASGTVQLGTTGAASLSDGTLTNAGIIRHTTDLASSFGSASFRALSTYSRQLIIGTGSQLISGGTGSPEGVVTAPVGSVWLRSDGGAVTTLYIKETGAGNTGWVVK